MTNNSSSSNPTPTGGSSAKSDNNSRQRIIAIAAVIIVALLALNAVLLIGYSNRGKAKAQLSSQLDETQQLKEELETQYYEALSELEEMRTDNEELNALIEKQKEELTAQKDKINGMLGDSRRLSSARKELNKLKAQVDQYIAEINQLREENQVLTTKTAELSEANESLNTNLEAERMANEELSAAKATLVSEKEELLSSNEVLNKKVTKASVVQVQELALNGLKQRKSGKAVKKNNAKNIEQLQVCFNTEANTVAEEGTEQFIIRIINPRGETLAIDEMGSGVFVHSETGEEIRYTQIKEMEYNQKEKQACAVWTPNQPITSGEYTVEVYNKGHLAGASKVNFK